MDTSLGLTAGDEALLAAIGNARLLLVEDEARDTRNRFYPVAVPYEELSPDEADPDADPHEIVVRALEIGELRRNVSMLPVIEREVVKSLWGIDRGPLGVTEAARRLGLHPRTVRQCRRQAISTLRGFYEHPEPWLVEEEARYAV